jgi:hypothetical protein
MRLTGTRKVVLGPMSKALILYGDSRATNLLKTHKKSARSISVRGFPDSVRARVAWAVSKQYHTPYCQLPVGVWYY